MSSSQSTVSATPSISFSSHAPYLATTKSMPSAMDWPTNPHHSVLKLLQQSDNEANNWQSAVDSFFKERLNQSAIDNLPDLDHVTSQDLVDGQVVKFRGMIQDLFDPEYYMSKFKVKDLTNGNVRLDTCMYRDIAPLGPREEVVDGSEETSERQSFYAVSVPGAAPWVQEGFKKKAVTCPVASGSAGAAANKLKRGIEVEENNEGVEMMEDEATQADAANGNSAGAGGDVVKKAKTNEGEATTSAAATPAGGNNALGMNHPLPGAKGKAAIIKAYTSEDTFALNEVYEFIGIVSLDPSLAQFPTDGTDTDIMAHFNRQEQLARSPPPSLVPRIHLLKQVKLVHSNPGLPQELPKTMGDVEAAQQCRRELSEVLTKALLGDALAAEYLLCHLVSRIYTRRDVLTLGKFSMNLFNVPVTDQYTRRLSTVLQLLIEKSHFMPMSVDTFNKNSFVPKKDYHANRLVSGLLQLSEGTHLLLDETAMANGDLTADGLKNLTSLGMLISWQKLEYDFRYHQLEFLKDVPCLVMSEGRSMLPNDSQLMLKPETTDIQSSFSSISSALTSEILDKFRAFITVARNLPFEVTDAVQTSVQDDFVNERAAGNAGMATAEDLHRHLVLARLLALSRGQSELTAECWSTTKEMEKQRRERMAHLPERARPNGPLAGNLV